jgi:hypothetical protein
MRQLGVSLLAVVGLALPTVAHAGNYGLAGCGLGAMAFGNDPGMIQILAATTNATFGTQTFGITSGTSECTEGGGVVSLDQKLFLQANRAHVMRDAAMGRGEYLATLATLMGCEAKDQSRFFQLTQKQHKELFAALSEEEIILRVKQAIAEDAALSGSCVRS